MNVFIYSDTDSIHCVFNCETPYETVFDNNLIALYMKKLDEKTPIFNNFIFGYGMYDIKGE